MADAGSSSSSAAAAASAARRGPSAAASPAGCRGARGCAPALGRLVRKLRRQSRLLCAAAPSSAARCCHQYDLLSYSRNFDFGSALDGNEAACSFASRFVLAAPAPAAARHQPQ